MGISIVGMLQPDHDAILWQGIKCTMPCVTSEILGTYLT
jgi:hypothetical protein